MATPVIMPRQGQSVESCILTEWKVNVGDQVAEGDVLAVIETDKASFDLESTASGSVLALFWEADDDVPVLANVAAIGNEGEDVEDESDGNEDQYSENIISRAQRLIQQKRTDRSTPKSFTFTPLTPVTETSELLKNEIVELDHYRSEYQGMTSAESVSVSVCYLANCLTNEHIC